MPTKIEWAEETWNPITGCTKISEGCQNCYAESMSHRLAGRYGYPKAPNQFRPTFHGDKLTQPRVWKKPRRVFVCSMGDLFHDDIDDKYIHNVLHAAELAPQHTYIFLTKRPWAMAEIMSHWSPETRFPNWWLGVTAENQQRADERIPILRSIPAAVRLVSVEPMLGSVSISQHMWPTHWSWDAKYKTPEDAIENGAYAEKKRQALVSAHASYLDWVICGGESGPGARPMNPDWVRALRDQCVEAGTPFVLKQWGEWGLNWLNDDNGKIEGSERMDKMGKKIAGRMLDGEIWNQYPKAGE